MMKRFLIIILPLMCMCHAPHQSSSGIDESTFVQIYCDVTQQVDQLAPQDRESFVDSILAVHQVTKEAFEQTVDYYRQDPVRWQRVFTAITNEFETRLHEQSSPAAAEQSKSRSSEKKTIQSSMKR